MQMLRRLNQDCYEEESDYVAQWHARGKGLSLIQKERRDEKNKNNKPAEKNLQSTNSRTGRTMDGTNSNTLKNSSVDNKASNKPLFNLITLPTFDNRRQTLEDKVRLKTTVDISDDEDNVLKDKLMKESVL